MIKLPSLHFNSEFSFLESTIRIDQIINFALEQKLDSLVLTDHNNLFGVGQFYNECIKNKIKPIIGLDLDVQNFRLILIAKNFEGYQELIRLSNLVLSKNIILPESINDSNIFIVDHPEHGVFCKGIENKWFKEFYANSNVDQNHLVSINTGQILEDSQNQILNVLHSISSGTKGVSQKKILPYKFLYEDNQTSHNIQKIINECNIVFPKNNEFNIPHFPNNTSKSSKEYLEELVFKSLEEKFSDELVYKTYYSRTKYELDVISKLGFEDYFLIIWDLVRWSKSKKIFIGPGRGSAAGSLVAFLLDITSVDPIKFNLIFERFLNIKRISMPDIDIDIQDSRRNEVIDYLFDKYGIEYTALISTFSRLGAKSAWRDVCRVFDIPMSNVNEVAKLIDGTMPLKDSYQSSAKFRAAIDAKLEYQDIFKIASQLEGLPRQWGIHPAGIVISKFPINLEHPSFINHDNYHQLQYDLDYLESNNLLKIDLLGLRNLSIIEHIQDLVKKRFKHTVNLYEIPLQDKITLDFLSKGQTSGIFQLESFGMRETLKEVGISSFEDIVAIISLFRPGPMSYISTYANRKNGKEVYVETNEFMKEVASSTYGILIYQEQIMSLVQKFANMPYEDADLLRRAISKKDANKIQEFKDIFLKASIANGQDQIVASKIFNDIESFGQYGFNRSHAVSYALIAYWMAFFKARFKVEFYASLINFSEGSQETIQNYIVESLKNKITIMTPSIIYSTDQVEIHNQNIVLPLSIIKGFGKSNIEKLLEVRKNYNFDNFFKTVSLLRNVGISKSNIESLIEAKTMSHFGNVSTLLNALDQSLLYADLVTINKDGQKIINFDIVPLPQLKVLSENIDDEIMYEIKHFNVLLSDKLLNRNSNDINIIDLDYNEPKTLKLYVEKISEHLDKKGQKFYIASMRDNLQSIDVTIFPNDFGDTTNLRDHIIVEAKIVMKMYNGRKSYYLNQPWEICHG